MANTYLQIYVHFVFAVKGRANLIPPKHQEELNKYITGITTNKQQKLLAIGGMPDHLHVFVGMNHGGSISDLVRDLKANSAKFINAQRWFSGKFAWQEGFGGFSYSHSQLHQVIQYILHQPEHRRQRSFKEEYLTFLQQFAIPYDERYVFEWVADEGKPLPAP
jgi:putative transposase